jgi:hypothetical protein
MHSPTKRIRGFADACSALFAIERRFEQAHAVASLDDDGRVIDLTVFTRDSHTIDDARNWASCLTFNEPDVTRMVLMSLRPEGVTNIRESDMELYRKARDVFGRKEVDVVDWLLYDGELVRSVAITCGLKTWEPGM